MSRAAYPSYKASGVEWLGEVPEHWEVGNIRRFAMMRTGHTPSRTEGAYWEDCEIPWFTLKDIWQLRDGRQKLLGETAETISKLGLANSAAELLPTNTVVFSRTASVGFSGIMPRPMATSQDFWNWVCGPKLVPDYLLHTFRAMRGEFDRLMSGSTHKTIYQADAASLRIAVPSIDEQRSIAAFLDRETAKVDLLIGKKRELIERLAEKRQALISRTVTRGLPPDAARAAGLDPHPPMKDSGIDWLGEVPKHWETPPVNARFRVDLGKMVDAKRITGEHPIRYLRNTDVRWDRIHKVGLPEMDILPAERLRFTVEPGDILACEGRELGRCAIVGEDSAGLGYQKALHRIRPRTESESPRYFCYTLRWANGFGIFTAEGNPNTIPHLPGEKLRRYRFPRPPLPEQEAIASFLDIETEKLDAMTAKVEEAIDRLQEFRTALITAAVTGKIDVRGEA